MPINIQCPSCKTPLKVPDAGRNRRIKCKQCDHVFVVEAPREDPDEPRRRQLSGTSSIKRKPSSGIGEKDDDCRPGGRVEDDDDQMAPRGRGYQEDDETSSRRDDRGKRRKKPKRPRAVSGWVIGAAVLPVVVVVAVMILILRPGQAGKNQQAQAPPDKLPAEQAAAGSKDVPPKLEPEPTAKPLSKVILWKVKPDPGPALSGTPVNPQATFPLVGGNWQLAYPSVPSRFVAVHLGGAFVPQQGWYVVDLITMKPLAILPGARETKTDILSPDGQMLAAKQLFGSNIEVIHFAAGRKTQIQVARDAELFDFAASGRVLTVRNDEKDALFQVWDVSTSESVGELKIKSSIESLVAVLSAGRNFLAVCSKDITGDNFLKVFDLRDGALAAEVSVPVACSGLSFSGDGQELAALFEMGGKATLLSWNVAKGINVVEHLFAKDLRTLANVGLGPKVRAIDWLPDRSGWLAYGGTIVDYETGELVWTSTSKVHLHGGAARLCGHNVLVQVGGPFAKDHLELVALPAEQIAAARKSARVTGLALGNLPAKVADWSKVRNVPSAGAGIAWKVGVEAGQAPRQALPSVIAMTGKMEDVVQVQFSRADVGQAAAVRLKPISDASTKRQVCIDRFDLIAKRRLETVGLFSILDQRTIFPGQPVVNEKPLVRTAISPDAATVAAYKPGESRLDVWTCADGKHLAGWRPFETETKTGGQISWFDFLDARRIFTASYNGKVVLWQLPECNAIYSVEGFWSGYCLSPDGKYLTACNGSGLEFLDSSTGESRGRLQDPRDGQVAKVVAVAFRTDGKEVAAQYMSGKQGTKIGRWTLKDGALVAAFPGGYGRSLSWHGSHFLFDGRELFDLKLQQAVTAYELPSGRWAQGSPDGRIWFTNQKISGKGKLAMPTLLLEARSVPDSSTQDLLDAIAGGRVQRLIGPGTVVHVSGSGGSAQFTAAVNALKNSLQAQGLKIGSGGLTLTVQAQEQPTGKSLTYTPLTPGAGKAIQVQERKVTCVWTLTDAQGTTLAKQDMTLLSPQLGVVTSIPDINRFLSERVWSEAVGYVSSIRLPMNIYRHEGKIIRLPQSVSLAVGP